MKKKNLDKQGIVDRLREYCGRYESQNKAAASLKGVSAATISQMINGNWDLIKDEMCEMWPHRSGTRLNSGRWLKQRISRN